MCAPCGTQWPPVALGGRRWLAWPFRRISKIGWLGSCSAPAQISVRSALVGVARSAAQSGAWWCAVDLENWAPLNTKVDTWCCSEAPVPLGATHCRARWTRRCVHLVAIGGTRWPRPRNSMTVCALGGIRRHARCSAVVLGDVQLRCSVLGWRARRRHEPYRVLVAGTTRPAASIAPSVLAHQLALLS